jgi:hypothetical protein
MLDFLTFLFFKSGEEKVQKCMQVSESRVQILGRVSVSISLC